MEAMCGAETKGKPIQRLSHLGSHHINSHETPTLLWIISQFVGCRFVLLTVSFALQKLCSFMKSHLGGWVEGFLGGGNWEKV